MEALEIEEFLAHFGPIADVRSPSEFLQGHILQSVNIPLLDDRERKEVGTLYKQKGMQEAFSLGLKYVGPKLAGMVQLLRTLANDNLLRMYCFRGGLRSSSIADLLHKSGTEVVTLKGGYKAYRRFCLSQFDKPLTLKVIGGATGSGKTELLQSIQKLGEQVLDLEYIASHRGSVFGHIDQGNQPTQEQFENQIAEALRSFHKEKPVWIEDESRMIGTLKIPDPLFLRMQSAPLIVLQRPLEARIKALLNAYGQIPLEEFTASVTRIKKRLGLCRFKEILELAKSGKWAHVVEILITYYDKAYKNSLKDKAISFEIPKNPNFDNLATQCIDYER